MTQSTADIKTASFDPYYLDPRDVMEPPTEFSKIIKKSAPASFSRLQFECRVRSVKWTGWCRRGW